MQTEFFSPTAALRREDLSAGSSRRAKSRGCFALCLDKAPWTPLSSPDLNSPVGQGMGFSGVYREQGGALFQLQGPAPKKAGREGQFPPDYGETSFSFSPSLAEKKLPGRAEEAPSAESAPQQEGQLPGKEGGWSTSAEGKEPAGFGLEEALFPPETPVEGAAVKELSSLEQGSEEPGLGEFALARELFHEQGNSEARLLLAETPEGAVPEYKSPAELLFTPAEASPASGPDSLQQQLQHDTQFFSLMSGENCPEELPVEILPPRQENQDEAQGFVGTAAEETGESGSFFVTRRGSFSGNEPAGAKGTVGEVVNAQDTAAGERVGAWPAEVFSSGEAEDPVKASVQNSAGGAGENQYVQGSFRPTAEAPVLTNFSGEIIPQIVEQAGHLAMSGAQELRLRLQPEFLGEVLIRVRRLQGVLSAEIITQHLAVKEFLEGQLETLRQRFQEVNLPVEHLAVFVQAEGKNGFASAGDAGARASPGAFKAGGTGENALVEENGDFSPGLWGEGRRVDCLV